MLALIVISQIVVLVQQIYKHFPYILLRYTWNPSWGPSFSPEVTNLTI